MKLKPYFIYRTFPFINQIFNGGIIQRIYSHCDPNVLPCWFSIASRSFDVVKNVLFGFRICTFSSYAIMYLFCPIKGYPVKVKVVKSDQRISTVCYYKYSPGHLIAKYFYYILTHHWLASYECDYINTVFLKGLFYYFSPVPGAQLI